VTEFLSNPIAAVVVLLGFLVFFHEFGHFIVGRLSGIAVEVFSIGFGPRIFGFRYRGTDYRVSWIPLGGYVKFAGSAPGEKVPPGIKGRAFLQTSLPRRAATVVAGPAANFLLAVAVYMGLGLNGIPHPPALIGEVIDGTPAATAGLRYGDKIVRIGDHRIKTWRDLEDVLSKSPGKTLNLKVERDGQQVGLTLTPDPYKTTDMVGRPVTIGRAGVALGRQPAIVTVIQTPSAGQSTVIQTPSAGQSAGLKTGQRVDSVSFAGTKHQVQCYPDLVQALRRAAAQPAVQSVILAVSPALVPTDSADDRPDSAGNEKAAAVAVQQVTLDLRDVKGIAQTVTDRQFMRALGLTDSELTVAAAEAPAADVLRKGDVLLDFNGRALRDVYALREELVANKAHAVTLTVLREGHAVDLSVALKGIQAQRPEGMVTLYTLPVLFWGQPVQPDPVIEQYTNPFRALAYGVSETSEQTAELVVNIGSLITGSIPLKALGGPMLIAKVAGDSARRGMGTYLASMALISINLGLLNLFPIPVLDGGQLALMGAEAIRRRPLRETAIENFQKVGFAMIMALVVLATYNDLSRFWRSMLESVVGIFH